MTNGIGVLVDVGQQLGCEVGGKKLVHLHDQRLDAGRTGNHNIVPAGLWGMHVRTGVAM